MTPLVRDRERQGHDKDLISRQDEWPHWPRLPMKRVWTASSGNQDMELGVILGTAEMNKEITVYLNANIFGNLKPEDLEVRIYDNVDAMLADGWTVD